MVKIISRALVPELPLNANCFLGLAQFLSIKDLRIYWLVARADFDEITVQVRPCNRKIRDIASCENENDK
eukprot:Awhi_evm1s3447